MSEEESDNEEANMDYRFASFCLTDPSQDPDLPDSPTVLLAELLEKSEVGFESYLAEFTKEQAMEEEDLKGLYEDGDGPETVRMLEFFTTKKQWKEADKLVENLMNSMKDQ